MEEKKEEKKTRIKEWIMVIGTIVLVTTASILAYNYGLNKKQEATIQKEEHASNSKMKLDLTSRVYNNNTQTLPEYLAYIYLDKIGYELENNNFEYNNKVKALVSIMNTNPTYSENHLMYSYNETSNKSIDLFGNNYVEKIDYISGIDKFLYLEEEQSFQYDPCDCINESGYFNIIDTNILNNDLILNILYIDNASKELTCNLIFNINDDNTVTFKSFEVLN